MATKKTETKQALETIEVLSGANKFDQLKTDDTEEKKSPFEGKQRIRITMDGREYVFSLDRAGCVIAENAGFSLMGYINNMVKCNQALFYAGLKTNDPTVHPSLALKIMEQMDNELGFGVTNTVCQFLMNKFQDFSATTQLDSESIKFD